jgi:hypothetical protein
LRSSNLDFTIPEQKNEVAKSTVAISTESTVYLVSGVKGNRWLILIPGMNSHGGNLDSVLKCALILGNRHRTRDRD